MLTRNASHLVAAGAACALIAAAAILPAGAGLADLPFAPAVPELAGIVAPRAAEDGPELSRNPYANDVQGYALLYDGGAYGIVEQDGRAGQTVFYLKDSIAETPTSFGSLFTVFYNADWDGNPTVDQYFEELLHNVEMESGDSFFQISEGNYQTISLAGVDMPAAAWYRHDADCGRDRFEMRAFEPVAGGGFAVWSMSAVDEEVDVVLQGLTEAVATFRDDPAAFRGADAVTVDAASLAQRPRESSAGGGSRSPDGPGGAADDAARRQAPLSYTPVEFGDGRSFTMKVPQGWKVSWFGGSGVQALVEAYDPDNPAVRMSFWGTQQVPASWNVANAYGMPFVLGSHTVAAYVDLFDELSAYAVAMGEHGFPTVLRVTSVEVTGSAPMSVLTDALATGGLDWAVADESLVTADMVLDDGYGTPVKAIVYATVIPSGFTGFEYDNLQLVYVVTAPADMIDDVYRALLESGCYGSFEVIGSNAGAADGGVISVGTTAGGSTYDPSEGILDSYYYQQSVNDSAMQAWDDYILGRDRYGLDDGSDLLVYYE